MIKLLYQEILLKVIVKRLEPIIQAALKILLEDIMMGQFT
jgi:hypothetical protein